jgi:hypothetical protein
MNLLPIYYSLFHDMVCQAMSREIQLFLEAEERGELISRTILDEWGNPIGTITLFDVQEKA